ncbi:hypothetical protein CA235_17225 [Sphingomonas sp. ABOLF]|uniref:hypothetical protein n=1 Tax=Sphingomonas sp. ABOLF TaxID=1985879 RepID=UPI000F7D97A6|nr:hypothetical protein [Sphingomonas sp. ABOLF]RSV12406.1 hypothetical protein CA235_17225 [Sphingomonas sp. ABOLF]
MRQAKRPADVRDEAYRLALEAARDRDRDGDPEGAGVIRDLAASIRRIRLTRDAIEQAPARTVGDMDLNVRLRNTLGATSPAELVGDVLDNEAHPLRSKLRKRDLAELTAARADTPPDG